MSLSFSKLHLFTLKSQRWSSERGLNPTPDTLCDQFAAAGAATQSRLSKGCPRGACPHRPLGFSRRQSLVCSSLHGYTGLFSHDSKNSLEKTTVQHVDKYKQVDSGTGILYTGEIYPPTLYAPSMALASWPDTFKVKKCLYTLRAFAQHVFPDIYLIYLLLLLSL